MMAERTKGFTSIELIIVLLMLAVLGAVIAVKNPFSIKEYSILAMDQVEADIRTLKLKARETKKAQNILFNINDSTYQLREGTDIVEEKKLPKTVIVTSASFGGSNVLFFNTLGEPISGGTMTLGDSSGTQAYLQVDSITGRILTWAS